MTLTTIPGGGKPYVAPKEARMVWFDTNGAKRLPRWTIFKIVASYDSYKSKQFKLNVSSHAKR